MRESFGKMHTVIDKIFQDVVSKQKMLQRKDSLNSITSQSHEISQQTPVLVVNEPVDTGNKSMVSNFIEAIDELGSENEHSYLLNGCES